MRSFFCRISALAMSVPVVIGLVSATLPLAGRAAVLTNQVYLPIVPNSVGGPSINASGLIGVEVTGLANARDAVGALSTAQTLGVGFVRHHQISWAVVESTRGSYDFSASDVALQRAASLGGRPLVIVQGTPAWARPNAASSANGPFPDEFLPDYANFWKAVVARYSQPPYNVRHWEVYNEPDNTREEFADSVATFGNSPVQYATVLRTAYQAIKSADSGATVLFGSLAHDFFNDVLDAVLIPMEQGGAGIFRRDFLERVLAAGGGASFDGLGYHYYPDFDARWLAKKPLLQPNVIAAKADSLRDVLRKFGLDKPLYLTEMGTLSADACAGKGTPDGQAQFLVKAAARAHGASLRSAIWFRLTDDAVPATKDCFAYNGLIASDGTPKPAFTTLQLVIQRLAPATFIRQLSTVDLGNSNVEGYLFRTEQSKDLRVLWTKSGALETILIPGASSLSVTRKDGTTAVIGGAALSVAADPILVTSN